MASFPATLEYFSIKQSENSFIILLFFFFTLQGIPGSSEPERAPIQESQPQDQPAPEGKLSFSHAHIEHFLSRNSN